VSTTLLSLFLHFFCLCLSPSSLFTCLSVWFAWQPCWLTKKLFSKLMADHLSPFESRHWKMNYFLNDDPPNDD
jgi:hypothetical protein